MVNDQFRSLNPIVAEILATELNIKINWKLETEELLAIGTQFNIMKHKNIRYFDYIFLPHWTSLEFNWQTDLTFIKA